MRHILLTSAVVLSGFFFLASDASAQRPTTYSGYVQSRLTGHSSHSGSHYSPRSSYYRGSSQYYRGNSSYGRSYGHNYGHHPRRPHYDWHDTSHYDYHPGGFQRHGNHYHYVPGHYDYHREGHWDFHR